ncbi:hypothetical protein ACP4OV_005913 [Aristida adscensionis]
MMQAGRRSAPQGVVGDVGSGTPWTGEKRRKITVVSIPLMFPTDPDRIFDWTIDTDLIQITGLDDYQRIIPTREGS